MVIKASLYNREGRSLPEIIVLALSGCTFCNRLRFTDTWTRSQTQYNITEFYFRSACSFASILVYLHSVYLMSASYNGRFLPDSSACTFAFVSVYLQGVYLLSVSYNGIDLPDIMPLRNSLNPTKTFCTCKLWCHLDFLIVSLQVYYSVDPMRPAHHTINLYSPINEFYFGSAWTFASVF